MYFNLFGISFLPRVAQAHHHSLFAQVRCYGLNCVPPNVCVEILIFKLHNVMLFGDRVFTE